MITSWWPASLTVGAGSAQGTYDINSHSMSTCAKISQVSKFLCTLLWASLVYGVRGQLTEPFPAQFELSSLNGTNGFVLHGEQENNWSGYAVSILGDVNDDGVGDLLIGAYKANPVGRPQAGKTYVVFGKAGPSNNSSLNLSSLNGQNGFVLNGEQGGDFSGVSVSSGGDVNGDGVMDFLIGANHASPSGRVGAGKTYVIFGYATIGSGGSIELSKLNGQNGFVLNGDQRDDHSGTSVSIGGDINRDGVTDLIIGAWNASPLGRTRAGRTYVVFGKVGLGSGGSLDLTKLNGQNGFVLNGEQGGELSGVSVSSGGDVNGDGVTDLLIGAFRASPNFRSDAGKTYVVFGKKGLGGSGSLDLSSLDGQSGIVLIGEQGGDWSGYSISNAGDVNGDNFTDILIGAHGAAPFGKSDAGKTYVVFGKAGLGSGGRLVELSSLNGTNGFVLHGEQRGDFSGRRVSNAADVDGDGVKDILIGAEGASPSGRSSAGKTYVIFGKAGLGSGGNIELSSLDGINGFVLNGEQAADRSGYAVSGAGDVNGDGVTDLLIGAYGASSSGRVSAGKTYIVYGLNGNFPMTSLLLKNNNNSHLTTPYNPQSTTNLGNQTSRKAGKTKNILIASSKTTLINSSLFLFSTHIDSHQASSPSDTLPQYAGITAAIAALVCSIFAGGLFLFRKRKQQFNDIRGTQLENQDPSAGYLSITPIQQEMQTTRVDSTYNYIPPDSHNGHYKEWPQQPAPSDPKHYTSIDQVEKQHDAYAAAKFEQVQANYDEIST